MSKFKILLTALFCFMAISNVNSCPLPNGFVQIDEFDPSIQIAKRYYTEDNFVGRKIKGYNTNQIRIKSETAEALKKVQAELKEHGLSLIIYDGFRPQTATDDFIAWSKDLNDNKMKEWFYPNIDKKDVFKLGYVAEKSNHTLGNTIDVSLIPLNAKHHDPKYMHRKLPSGKDVPYLNDGSIDMGSSFDLFDEVSHSDFKDLSKEARKNRDFLKAIMEKHGFKGVDTEWWHFSFEK